MRAVHTESKERAIPGLLVNNRLSDTTQIKSSFWIIKRTQDHLPQYLKRNIWIRKVAVVIHHDVNRGFPIII